MTEQRSDRINGTPSGLVKPVTIEYGFAEIPALGFGCNISQKLQMHS